MSSIRPPAPAAPALGQRERQQTQHRRAPGERLGDVVDEAELLAAGQDEQAVAADFVGVDLQTRQEFRHVVHLVEDGALGEPRQEPPGVGLRVMPNAWILEVGVPQVGERGAAQRGLARVARPGDGDERVLLEGPQKVRRDLPLDHDASPTAGRPSARIAFNPPTNSSGGPAR